MGVGIDFKTLVYPKRLSVSTQLTGLRPYGPPDRQPFPPDLYRCQFKEEVNQQADSPAFPGDRREYKHLFRSNAAGRKQSGAGNSGNVSGAEPDFS